MPDISLPKRVLPRDVRTRWNSTYQMLAVAVEYKEAVDKLTADKKLSMRKYELSEAEWKIATDLRDVLQVRAPVLLLDACSAERLLES